MQQQPTSASRDRRRLARPVVAFLLFLAGVRAAMWVSDTTHSSALYSRTPTFLLQLLSVSVAAGVVAASPVGAFIAHAASRNGRGRAWRVVSSPSPRARRLISFAVWFVATVYLTWTAHRQGRELLPLLHDEQSYALGARMLAHGRLWMPQHPLADFFDTFHVLVRPVYASIYFPGTALLNAPGVWLGLPIWVIPVTAAGLVAALTYRVTAELAGGAPGLLAALLVVSVGLFRTFSTMVMAHLPVALFALAAVWAWLRWRRSQRPAPWGLAVGAFLGWAAITRPADALAFALPLGLAMALDLRRGPPRAWVWSAAVVVLGALPFLALQAAFNVGATRNWRLTPYTLYLRQSQPGSEFASRELPTAPALSTSLPQKVAYFHDLVEDEREERQGGTARWLGRRVAYALREALPSAGLVALLAVGLGAAARQRRWALGAAFPSFLLLYLFNPFFMVHYAVPLVPAGAFLVALGVREAASAGRTLLRPAAARAAAAVFFPLVTVGLAVRALPEVDHGVSDSRYRAQDVRQARGPMRDAVRPPAVVLFRYPPGGDVHDEPVYNADVTWPDDAPIVRAHDLGPRNVEIYDYFARRQPGRNFYRFDRADGTLTPLGTAAELAKRLEGRAATEKVKQEK